MTGEDLSMAMHFNQNELENGATFDLIVEKNDELDGKGLEVVDSRDDVTSEEYFVTCLDCGDEISIQKEENVIKQNNQDTVMAAQIVDKKESVSTMKELVEAQDKGIQIEYR